MSEIWDSFVKFFTSLRVTVVLLALSIVLIFVATLDQVNLGIWAVQEKYFRTFFVLWHAGDIDAARRVPAHAAGHRRKADATTCRMTGAR